jgi:hypothetical protein
MGIRDPLVEGQRGQALDLGIHASFSSLGQNSHGFISALTTKLAVEHEDSNNQYVCVVALRGSSHSAALRARPELVERGRPCLRGESKTVSISVNPCQSEYRRVVSV